jgi:hypothetical protein
LTQIGNFGSIGTFETQLVIGYEPLCEIIMSLRAHLLRENLWNNYRIVFNEFTISKISIFHENSRIYISGKF